jgi:hypothetical protein
MIRFYLDSDDDFDVEHGLDITDEIISWETQRAADRISRAETEGNLVAVLRRGRATASWWRVGRLLEARVDDFVFFRGFLLDATGTGNGKTRIRALTWIQHLHWRGRNAMVVGLNVIDAVREVINAAANGLPGATHPSARLIESIFGETRPRRLFWRLSDAPLFWRTPQNPLYWRVGPAPDPDAYHYGRVGARDVVGNLTLAGPPQPAVAGTSNAVVDRLTAIEYAIENYEFGLFHDELAALAGGERGWLFSGSSNDIDCLGRANSASPTEDPMTITTEIYGRYAYAWSLGNDAIGQIIGREPDVQESEGILYRQDNVRVAEGVSSWTVPLRNRGRPAEASGDFTINWPMKDGLSVNASAAFGDLLIEVFNETGGATSIDWIEVSGTARVYQGGIYQTQTTGRYGGRSIELSAVFGGSDELISALDYWTSILGVEGVELASVTLDGRRFASAWLGQIGGLADIDALQREGLSEGPTRYWIVGVHAHGDPKILEIRYDLMRYARGN